MRLTLEEYRCGILSWDLNSPAVLRVCNAPEPRRERWWSEPLNDPKGSVLPFPLQPNGEIEVAAEDPTAGDRPLRVRLERLANDEVETVVWEDSLEQPPVVLPLVPDYGHYHRLLVATPHLTWAAPCVVRGANAAIRFLLVAEERDVSVPVYAAGAVEGGLPERFRSERVCVARGQIDVIAPGDSEERAAIDASAVLGLVALCLGDLAAGVILGRYSYDVPRRSEGEWRHRAHVVIEPQAFSSMLRPIELVDLADLDLVDHVLPSLFPNGGITTNLARARCVALRSYERGVRAPSFLDKFLAFFMGIETIVRSCNPGSGPPSPLARLSVEPRFTALLEELQPEYEGIGLIRVFGEMLSRRPIAEYFSSYATARDLADASAQFGTVRRLRDDLVHGRPVSIGPEQAAEAKRLLVRLLKAELGLPQTLRWEAIPVPDAMWLGGPLEQPTTLDIAAFKVAWLGPSS